VITDEDETLTPFSNRHEAERLCDLARFVDEHMFEGQVGE